jgi:hypothetical protein
MNKRLASIAITLLVLLGLTGPLTTVADELTQNFDTWTVGSTTNGQWSIGNGCNVSSSVVASLSRSFPNTLRFPNTSTNAFLLFPPITNGVGSLAFYSRGTVVSNFIVQTSSNLTNWTHAATIPFSSTNTFTVRSAVLNIYGSTYLRLYFPGTPVSLIYVDDITLSNPPANVVIESTSVLNTLGSPDILANDPVNVTATFTPYMQPSNIQMTVHYKHESGASNSAAMTSNGPLSFVTATPLLGQPAGRVDYYIGLSFQGVNAMSPTSYPALGFANPLSYLVSPRPDALNTSMVLTGGLSSAMSLVSNYQWEAFTSFSNASFSFQFRGLSNATTRLWGDTNQSAFVPPIPLVADLNGSAIQVSPSTNQGQLFVRFQELTSSYVVKEAVYQIFDSWTAAAIGNSTNNGWILNNGMTSSQTDRKLRSGYAVLESNTASWVRSPYLSKGIGEISFWYRNFNTNGSPATAAYIEKSQTGGTNDNEWMRIDTINSLATASYLRKTVVLSDRNYNYVRIRNSTNYPNARLCLDEILVGQPGAGVVFSSVTNAPALPSASNTVSVSAVINSLGDATNLSAKVWYRTGSTGVWASVTMTNAGSSFSTLTPIPAGRGDGPGGSGTVQYYLECGFAGYESTNTSPFFYPAATSNAPLSYIVQSAKLVGANGTTEPVQPLLNNSTHLRVDMTPQDCASNVSVKAYYRLNGTGGYTELSMSLLTGNTYQTLSSLPFQSVEGMLLEYYFIATFLGPNAASPTNFPVNAPSSVLSATFQIATLNSLMTVTGSLYSAMSVVNGFTWEALIPYTGTTFGVRFQGLSNGITRLWGDANQSTSIPPFALTAETNTTAIQVNPSMNTGHLVLRFLETTREYTIKQAAVHVFDGWTFASPGNSTNNNWILQNGFTAADPGLQLRGRYLVLESNSTSWICSPYLPGGIGEIAFWYRHSNPAELPAAGVYVEKSKTGGTNDSDWTRLATATNLSGSAYTRFTLVQADRDFYYVRVRSTTNYPNARVCLDELLVAQPGASVSITNVTATPANPTATNPVTIACTITSYSGASGLAGKVWYRTGTTGLWTSITMTRAVNVFTASSPIPAGKGEKPDGSGTVQYYVECAYTGYESTLSSPAYSPTLGSADPLSYTVLPASVTATNAATVPAPPLINSANRLRLDILPSSGASNITPTAWYRIGGVGAYQSLSMSLLSNQTYQTDSIIPTQTVAGILLDYYFAISFAGPDAQPTNYPANATSTVFSTVFQVPAWTSAYYAVAVTGDVVRTMTLMADKSWRAILTTNTTNARFRFAGTGNGSPVWQDLNQAMALLPLFGTAETSGSDLLMTGTVSGSLLFQFNETNLQYTVQKAAYSDIAAWPTGYSWSTNSTGWLLAGRANIPGNTNDMARVFDGPYLVLEGGSSTNNFLRSPNMTNGIGEVSFFYRNYDSTGTRPLSFEIQASSLSTGPWTTVQSVSNVLSVNYRYFNTVLANSRIYSHVRIKNTSPAQTDRLCLDETVVSDEGAAVALTSVTRTPSAPSIMDEVQVSVTATPRANATILPPVLWYKATTNAWAYYESVNMINVSGSLYRGTIPRGPIGPMFYYIQCGYSGLFSDTTSPTYSPLANSAAPLSYTNVDGGLFEGFESWPYTGTTVTTFTNASYLGWQVYNSFCRGEAENINYYAAPGSTNRAIWLTRGTPFNRLNESLIISPVITNLYGAVHLTFMARSFDPNLNNLGVYWTYSANPSTNYADTNVWQQAAYLSGIPYQSWSNCLVDFTNNLFRIMIRKESGNSLLGIDRVEIAQRSSMVTFSNLVINPGYPGTNEPVYVSCEIDTLRPGMTAFNFQPSLYYRSGGVGNFMGPIGMSRTPGTRTFTTTNPIPASTAVWDTNVYYYIYASFDGYSHSAELNNSPMPYPADIATGALLTTLTGGDPFTFMPRLKPSAYGTLDFTGNRGTLVMDLLENYTWQGVLRLNSTVSGITFNFKGNDHFTGSGFSLADTNWGQLGAQWKTNLPLADFAVPGQGLSMIAVDPLLDQYVARMNERTGEYSLRACAAQKFDDWSTTTNYTLSGNSGSDVSSLDFNDWPTNITRILADNFGNWYNPTNPSIQYISYYTNRWYGGTAGWGIYEAQLTNNTGVSGSPAIILAPDITYTPYYQGRVTLNCEQLIQPLEGIGTISFSYRAAHTNDWNPTNSVWSPSNPIPVSISVNLSSNGLHEIPTYWETVANITNIIGNVSFGTFSMAVNTSAYRSVIIAHSAGASKLMIDNVSASDFSASSFATNGWSASEIWMQRNSGCNLVTGTNGLYMAIEFNGRRFNTNAYLQSPLMTNGVGFLDFYYMSASNQAVGFDINFYKGIPPYESTETLFSVTNATNTTYRPFSLLIMTNEVGYIRLIPTSQNRLFIDDVRITGIPPTNSWQANNAKIANEFGSRFRLNAVYLNSNGVTDVDFTRCNTQEWPYVRTPQLNNGIGEISFWYRNYDSGIPATIRIQKSITGANGNANWTDVAVISNIVNKNFAYYRTNLYDNTYKFIRILNDTNQPLKARVVLDEILVAAPMAADCKLANLRISPEAPVYTNAVHVYMDVQEPFLYPSNFLFETLYSVGTNYGNWTYTNSRAMMLVSSNIAARTWTYRTEDAIPSQASDRFVMYQVRGGFDGLNAAGNTSPKTNRQFATPSFYYPLDYGTNTPYYIVLSAATNAVWINEIDPGNVKNFGTLHKFDFVEICGAHNINIGNWKVAFFSSSAVTGAVYTIPLNTLLPNNTNGFGFHVIGKSTVSNNMLLTNNIPYPGGVALLRPAGMYSSPIAFGSSLSAVNALVAKGFVYIGSDDAQSTGTIPLSISLTGSGSNRDAFSWPYPPAINGYAAGTPNAINTAQTLIGSTINQNSPPSEVAIIDFWFDSQKAWLTVTGTNYWLPSPWFTTNLMVTDSWATVSAYLPNPPVLDTNDWTYTLSFPIPTSNPAYYYKVITTNASPN